MKRIITLLLLAAAEAALFAQIPPDWSFIQKIQALDQGTGFLGCGYLCL